MRQIFFVCAAVLLHASVASAGVITIGPHTGHTLVYLGLDGAGGFHQIFGGVEQCDDALNCEIMWDIYSTVDFRSGPLLSLTQGFDTRGEPHTWYEYGPGEIAISVFDDVNEIGEFHAPVEGFTLAVHEGSDFEGCTFCPKLRFGAVPRLGEGRFDPELAAFFGVSQRTAMLPSFDGTLYGGAYWSFAMVDYISGDATSALRIGESWFGIGVTINTAVPEPHLTVLSLVGVASVLVRRFKRAAQSCSVGCG
jgi:hypothetical protein